MSEEVKIDEKYLQSQFEKAVDLAKFIVDQAKQMNDKKEDIFIRYMSFIKIKAIFQGADMALDISRDAFGSGHNLNHPFMMSAIAKENEWDQFKLEQHPFFTNDAQEKMHEFKNMIGSAIFSALKEAVQDSKKETPASH